MNPYFGGSPIRVTKTYVWCCFSYFKTNRTNQCLDAIFATEAGAMAWVKRKNAILVGDNTGLCVRYEETEVFSE